MTLAEEFLRDQGLNLVSMNSLNIRTFEMVRHIRYKYVNRFGFAVLTTTAAKQLQKYGAMFEVGAGSGYWSFELKRVGVDIVATEPHPENPKELYMGARWKRYTDIEELDALSAVRKYAKRTLLTVWPDYDARWAYDMLVAYKGPRVIYAGEGEGGCTGGDDFHMHLQKYFRCKDRITIPQFVGIYDDITVWERRK